MPKSQRNRTSKNKRTNRKTRGGWILPKSNKSISAKRYSAKRHSAKRHSAK